MLIHNEAPHPGRPATRLYRIWSGMRNRCNNPRNKNYRQYGGQGVTVCEEWDDYLAFKQWAIANGYSEELTLDRVDPAGGYEPNNCRWITRQKQSRNKRDTALHWDGEEWLTLPELAEKYDIKYGTLKARVNRYHWPLADALNLPARLGNNGKMRGEQNGD